MNYKTIIISLKRLFKNGFFHIIGSTTLNKIITFASTWILVRIISKADYGVYTYAYNIYSFLFLLNGFGIGSAILQLCSEKIDDNKKSEYYKFGTRFGILVDIFLAIIIIVIGLTIPLPIQGSNELLVLMCAIPIFSIIPEMQSYYLRYNQFNKKYSYNNIVSSIVVLACSVIMAILFKSKGLVFAGYISQIIIGMIALWIFKAPISLKKSNISKEDIKTLLGIAIISMLNNGLSRLMYLLDIFVLGIVIPDSSIIASYRIATNIPTALQFIPSAVIIYLYPNFARHKGDGDWLIKTYRKVIVPFGIFNLLLAAIMIIIAAPAIKLFFGTAYLDAVTPFRILSIGYFFSATFRTISGNLLVTQRKLKFNLFLSVFSGLLNTTLNIFMIKSWGSNGAAIATVVTSVIAGAISTFYLLRVFKNSKQNELVA